MSFNFDSGVFPVKPPRFVAGIYPFLGFPSPLEYYRSDYFDGNEPSAHGTFSRNPLAGSSLPTALERKWVSPEGYCRNSREHLHGLVTIMAFITLSTLSPVSCLKCSWDSPLRALCLRTKAVILTDPFCFHAINFWQSVFK